MTQVTVVPRVIISGLGAYAVVVRVLAPATMDTVAGAGGVGEGPDDGLLLPPHPARHSTERSVRLAR